MSRERRSGRWSGAVFGLVFLFVGVAFLLDQLDYLEVGRLIDLWPLILIAIGLAHFADGNKLAGAVWLILGVWFLALTFDYIDFSPFDAWALIPILIGVTLLRAPLQLGRRFEPDETHLIAVMAGNGARLRGEAPSTITATAVMGGVELDLRHLEPPEDGKVSLFVTTMWGGVEVTIPPGWEVENRLIPILAGVEVKGPSVPDKQGTLVIEGVGVMAGVEVRHA